MVKVVGQDDSKKSNCKPGKPVGDKSDIQVCKPERQRKQSHDRSQSLNIDSSEKQCTKVYTIKLSGLRFNVTERKIEKLVKPYGDLAGHVKILCYPENGVCYAYVDYCQRCSAEEAVLRLDKSDFSGTKIHVCHKGELGVKHNCRQQLEALKNIKSDMNMLSAIPSEPGTLPSYHQEGDQNDIEAGGIEHCAHKVTNLNPDVLPSTVNCTKANPTIEINSSDSSHRLSSRVYSIKLSGFRINIKESEIEWLVKPFGDLTGPVEISRYPDTNISYALVNYKQKNSAERAVSELDKREFNGKKIHVCHQGELAVDHDCCSVLSALNATVVDIDNLNNESFDMLEVLKTKSIKFINHLALTNQLDFKNALRSVTVSSCDHNGAHELMHKHDAQTSTALEVTNLHPDTWFQDLESHFKPCGSPISMCLHFYAYSSSAIICYPSSDIADNVMKQFDGSEINGYQIRIVRANYDISRTKSPVIKSADTRISKEVAAKPMMKENKVECSGASKKKMVLKG